MKFVFSLVLVILLIPAYSQDQWKNVYSESAWADRDTWQRSEEIICLLRLIPGSRVADIGCHEGYMTIKLSTKIGAKGIVYAVDLDQPRLDKLKQHLEARKISNVKILKGEAADPLLPVSTLDAVLVLDTYHEMKQHDQVLKHIYQALKPGGRLVLCEPIATERRSLARADQERKHELGISYALEDLKRAGFEISFQQDPFVDRMKIKGDKLWVIVAKR